MTTLRSTAVTDESVNDSLTGKWSAWRCKSKWIASWSDKYRHERILDTHIESRHPRHVTGWTMAPLQSDWRFASTSRLIESDFPGSMCNKFMYDRHGHQLRGLDMLNVVVVHVVAVVVAAPVDYYTSGWKTTSYWSCIWSSCCWRRRRWRWLITTTMTTTFEALTLTPKQRNDCGVVAYKRASASWSCIWSSFVQSLDSGCL